MAGTGQGLFVGVAVLGMVALGWAARAETIPLPTPAPLPKETGSPSKSGTAAQSGSSGLAAGVKSLFHLDREPETSATPVTTTTGFNAGQRAQVDKVSAYLSSMQQLVGDFVQLGPDGSRVLSQTPLRFLLSDRIDLLRETNVVGVRADDTFVTITIEEQQALIGTSRLMMMVGAKDFQLKQWTITDPQGYDTTVAVSNLDNSKRPDPNLFKIDYTRYIQ